MLRLYENSTGRILAKFYPSMIIPQKEAQVYLNWMRGP